MGTKTSIPVSQTLWIRTDLGYFNVHPTVVSVPKYPLSNNITRDTVFHFHLFILA